VKVGDVIIIILAVVSSLLIAFLTTAREYDSDTFSFVVKQESKIILGLTVDKGYQGNHKFMFDDYFGVVEIDEGKVRLQRMTTDVCPRQICSKLGWANRQGDILVCLPNKLVVEVIHKKGEEEYGADAISF